MNSELFRLIVHTAEQMIRCGAEIYRAEEGVTRACAAYGVERVDIFATTSQMVVSLEDGQGGAMTHSVRIYSATNDMEKLDRLNKLIRYISQNAPDAEYVKKELENIEHSPVYPSWVNFIMYGIISAAFCMFFGGVNFKEPVVAFFMGFLTGVILMSADYFDMNKILGRFVCSLSVAICAIALYKLGVISTPDNVIIGNIMCLISGIGLTNSLRDLFKGDTVTGVLRSIEAVLIALAIAIGYISAVFAFGGAV
jgi:uncharacterized membrane protein YjjP (DUF1212 family)